MNEILKKYLKHNGFFDWEIENLNKEETKRFLRSPRFIAYKNGYEQGVEYNAEYCNFLEEENAELKVQIEKMKFCGNCGTPKPYQIENPCTNCKNKDKWELAE